VVLAIGNQSGGDRDAFDDASDAAGGERCATKIDEQHLVTCGRIALRHEFVARAQVSFQRVRGGIAEGPDALFFPFSADADLLLGPVNVLQAHTGKLGIADTAAIEQLEDGQVSFGEGRRLRHL